MGGGGTEGSPLLQSDERRERERGYRPRKAEKVEGVRE